MWAGLVLLLAASFPYFGRFMNANERPRLLQAVAWIEEGSHAVDGPSARGIDPGIDVARSRQGRLVPNKPPGATVPAAAAWVLLDATAEEGANLRRLTWAARMLGGWLPTAVLLAVGLAVLRRRFGEGAGVAAVTMLALGTPLAAYARLLYGHTLAACLLFCGVVLLVNALEGSKRRAGLWALAGGVLAGSAVAVEYAAVFAALPIGVWLVSRLIAARGSGQERARSVSVGAAVLGALVPIVALAAYHQTVFGSPFSTPYHHVVDPEFARIHDRGLLGLSWPTATGLFEHALSPWGGVLYWAPLTAMAMVVSLRAWARGEAESFERVGVAIFAVQLLVVLCLIQTGGWRVGPRYLVLAMPFVLPGLARLASMASKRPGAMAIVLGAALWSVSINVLAAHLFPHLIPVGHPFVDQLLPLWADGLEPYGVGTPIVFVGALALLAVSLQQPEGPASRSAAAWATGLGLGLALLLGAAVLLPPAPAAEDNLQAIERIWEPQPHQHAPSPTLGPES